MISECRIVSLPVSPIAAPALIVPLVPSAPVPAGTHTPATGRYPHRRAVTDAVPDPAVVYSASTTDDGSGQICAAAFDIDGIARPALDPLGGEFVAEMPSKSRKMWLPLLDPISPVAIRNGYTG